MKQDKPDKKEENNPYVNDMTLGEVRHAEDNHFYLQVGNEVPIYNGRHTMSKDAAESIFWQMYDSLKHMSKEGKEQERVDAKLCLANFRILKLRIH